MFEFADVFDFDLTSTVFLAGSLVAVMIFATVAIWTNREPATVARFEIYGL
jgi:hypothetical protein